MSLLKPSAAKAQNRFNSSLVAKAAKILVKEYKELIDIVGLEALETMIAYAIDEWIANRRKNTAPTAPNVLFSDEQKIRQMVDGVSQWIEEKDASGELEGLIQALAGGDYIGSGDSH